MRGFYREETTNEIYRIQCSGRDRTNVALRTRDGVLFLYNLISDGK